MACAPSASPPPTSPTCSSPTPTGTTRSTGSPSPTPASPSAPRNSTGSLSEPWGLTPVPELYVRELARHPRLDRIAAGAPILPHLTAHAAPGHTPGHLIFHLQSDLHDVLFTGDAAKNRAELLSLSADMTDDPAISRASMEFIWTLWRQKPGTLLIPGHDLPMRLENDHPAYTTTRTAGIRAWFDDTIDEMRLFPLT